MRKLLWRTVIVIVAGGCLAFMIRGMIEDDYGKVVFELVLLLLLTFSYLETFDSDEELEG